MDGKLSMCVITDLHAFMYLFPVKMYFRFAVYKQNNADVMSHSPREMLSLFCFVFFLATDVNNVLINTVFKMGH